MHSCKCTGIVTNYRTGCPVAETVCNASVFWLHSMHGILCETARCLCTVRQAWMRLILDTLHAQCTVLVREVLGELQGKPEWETRLCKQHAIAQVSSFSFLCLWASSGIDTCLVSDKAQSDGAPSPQCMGTTLYVFSSGYVIHSFPGEGMLLAAQFARSALPQSVCLYEALMWLQGFPSGLAVVASDYR